MGKLVLFLADGSTLDIPLDRERLTIGRRADNDVCLPSAAVSGEHASVVTILDDSFLEDMGSTNGTLVNGKGVVKHFLRENDQIEIGRQRMVYVSDNDTHVDPLPPDQLRNQIRGLTDTIEPIRSRPVQQVSIRGMREANERQPAAPVDLDDELDLAARGPASGQTPVAPPAPVRPPLDTHEAVLDEARRAAAAEPATKVTTSRTPLPPAPVRPPLPRTAASPTRGGAVDTAGAGAPPPLPPAPTRPPEPVLPTVRVLSGPNLGRTLTLAKAETTVGRVGVQVAQICKLGAGFVLQPLEGSTPPTINGAAVPPTGAPLFPGDTFEVAGVRLELAVPEAVAVASADASGVATSVANSAAST